MVKCVKSSLLKRHSCTNKHCSKSLAFVGGFHTKRPTIVLQFAFQQSTLCTGDLQRAGINLPMVLYLTLTAITDELFPRQKIAILPEVLHHNHHKYKEKGKTSIPEHDRALYGHGQSCGIRKERRENGSYLGSLPLPVPPSSSAEGALLFTPALDIERK